MKKILFTLASFFLTTLGHAQLINGGFEQLRPDGSAQHWLPDGYIIFIIDSSCVNMGLDSMGFVTDEAHSGNHAYELRTASNCGTIFPGDVHPTRFANDTGFTDQRVYFAQRPTAISFYYKLLPAADDYGTVTVAVENEPGEIGGAGTVQLAAAADWTPATLPVTYTTADTDGYMRLRFNMANDTELHYGSRLLIDDVTAATGTTGINTVHPNSPALTCAATSAGDRLFIHLAGVVTTGAAMAVIRDAAGKAVYTETVQLPGNHGSIAIIALPRGVYSLQLATAGTVLTGRFIK